MKITRDQGQEAVVSCYQRWRYLFVEYCTGFGKGKASLDAVSTTVRESKHRTRGMIIVHSESARDRIWPVEIQKFAPTLLQDADVTIECYQSLKNYKGQKFDWVIGDEIHFITAKNSIFFDRNKILSLIIMTGTLPDDPYKIKLIQKLSNGNRLQITLDEAVDSQVLNDYRVNIWEVELTAVEWAEYLGLCAKVDKMTKTGKQFLIQAAIGDRTRFLYSLETKYKAACFIRDQIRAAGRRMVIFMGTKEMCDRISPYRLYEGSGPLDYQKFLDQVISEIASIKMIQEGENIPRLEASLIGQMSSKVYAFMQKLGRNMRLEIGEIARIHIVVAANTYDFSWVRKATKEIRQDKITWHKLDRSKFEHYE